MPATSGPVACLSYLLPAAPALPGTDEPQGEITSQPETLEDAKAKAKSKNTRARRLSYVQNGDSSQPGIPPPGPEAVSSHGGMSQQAACSPLQLPTPACPCTLCLHAQRLPPAPAAANASGQPC